MFGWWNRRFGEANRFSTDRSQIMFVLPEDSRHYLDSWSRGEIVRKVEWLSQTFGMVKEGGRGIARHTVGKGISLQLNTADLKWNAEAESQFEDYALNADRCDIAGRRSLYDMQYTAVEQRVFRGEFFASHTENPRWNEPCLQLWDTMEVCTPDAMRDNDRVFDGVQLDAEHNPLGYYVKTAGAQKHDFIPADRMVHWYQPLGINQVRGESDFAPAVNHLVDWRDLEKLVIKHAKTHSTLAVAVKKLAKVGGKGMFSQLKQRNEGTSEKAIDTAPLEKAFPGAVAYLGSDGEVELLTGNSPNEKLQPFLSDLLAPNIFSSLGLPAEFFWSVSKLSGANQRFILARADLLFQVLGDGVIYSFLNPVAYRFLSHRINTGKLARPADPNWPARMSWQTPARITVDNGRDGNLAIQLVSNGMDNLRGWYDRNGKFYRDQTRQWIREWLEFVQMAKEEGADDEMVRFLLGKWRSGMPGAGGSVDLMGETPNETPNSQNNRQKRDNEDEE